MIYSAQSNSFSGPWDDENVAPMGLGISINYCFHIELNDEKKSKLIANSVTIINCDSWFSLKYFALKFLINFKSYFKHQPQLSMFMPHTKFFLRSYQYSHIKYNILVEKIPMMAMMVCILFVSLSQKSKSNA